MPSDHSEYVSFSDVAVSQCGEQSQYASRAIDGRHGWPNLGKNLRFNGNPSDYHDVEIHRDDVAEFVKRYQEWRDDER